MSQQFQQDKPTAPLQAALQLANSAIPSALTETSTLEVYAFQLYGRAIRLATGAEVLLRAHYPEEALFLGRSLFEDSLRLADLVGPPATRQSLLLGWALASLQEGVGLAHTAVEAGLEESPEFLLQHLATERQRLLAHAERNGGLRPKRFRSVRDAAHAHGRHESLWTYSLAHEMVHGSDLSFLFNRRKLGSNAVAMHLRTTDANLEIGVACFCAESVLHAGAAFASIFSTASPETFVQAMKAIAALQEQLCSSGEGDA